MAQQQYVRTANSAIPQESTSLKEDVSPMISMIDPNMTPFLSRMKRERTKSNHPAWYRDFLIAPLPTPRPYAARVRSGVDNPFLPVTQAERRSNLVQVFIRVFSIGLEEERTEHHGFRSKLNRETRKHMAAIRRDMEVAMLQNKSATGTSTTTGQFNEIEAFQGYSGVAGSGANHYVGQMSGVPTFPESNVILGSNGTSSGSASTYDTARHGSVGGWKANRQAHVGRTTAGDSKLIDLDEGTIEKLSQMVFHNRGGNSLGRMILMGNTNQLASFARADAGVSGPIGRRITGVNPRGGISKINKIDVYETQYGALRFVPNTWMDMRTVYCLQMGAWRQKVLVSARRDILGKDGNTTDVMLTVAFTCCLDNELKMGAVFDLHPGSYAAAVPDYWQSNATAGASYDGTWKGKTGLYTGALTGTTPGFASDANFTSEWNAWRSARIKGGIAGSSHA